MSIIIYIFNNWYIFNVLIVFDIKNGDKNKE